MKVYYFIFLLLLLNIKTNAQTYTIPWATQQPAWVFPFWLEDGAGNKDTIYYCYDPNGHLHQTVYDFGDSLRVVDTSKFFGGFWGVWDKNRTNQVNVWDSSYMYYQNGEVSLFWSNASPPYVKISWDVHLFRSAILPFPTKAPAPKVQGFMWWGQGIPAAYPIINGIPACSYDFPIPMTDTNLEVNNTCFAKDSILFPVGCNPTSFFIWPWDGKSDPYFSVGAINEPSFTVTPNPSSDFINLQFPYEPLDYKVIVFTINGMELFNRYNQQQIEINQLPIGIYFIKIITRQTTYTSYFIKI